MINNFLNTMKNIFSITKEYSLKTHLVLTFFGVKIKFDLGGGGRESIYNNKIIPFEGFIYEGNPEFGLCSIETRIKNTEGRMEYEDMIVANRAIGKNFIKDSKRVVNIGAGVGTFEWQNAKNFPNTKFVASEFDKSQHDWTVQNRSIENVEYITNNMSEILNKYGRFDLAVCVDVLEHCKEYKKFLDEFVTLSDRAVISTPNRDRFLAKDFLVKPPFKEHPQEWNAGELYFILKMYYKNVKLYSLPCPVAEDITEVGIYSRFEKLIAYCEN